HAPKGRSRRARSGRSRPVLHARGAGARTAPPDEPLPRSTMRARVPLRTRRSRNTSPRGPREGRPAHDLRAARQRLPARRRETDPGGRRDRNGPASVPLRGAGKAARPARLPVGSPRRSGGPRAERRSRRRAHRRDRYRSGRLRGECAAALVPNAEVVVEPTLVTDVLPDGYDVLGCGPEPMLDAVRTLAPGAQLAWEAPMACGYGACYGCVVEVDGRYQRLCVEGPVLVA